MRIGWPDMDRRESEALDRHITGNYGEDQFSDIGDEWWEEECSVGNCHEVAVDGVLCTKHQPPEDILDWWDV